MGLQARCDVCGVTAEYPGQSAGWRVPFGPPMGIPGECLCPKCRALDVTALKAKIDLSAATPAQVEACARTLGVK